MTQESNRTVIRGQEVGFLSGLRSCRKAADISQADLARALGTSRESISAWESGKYWPSASVLPMLAEACRCRIEDLYLPEEGSEPDEEK